MKRSAELKEFSQFLGPRLAKGHPIVFASRLVTLIQTQYFLPQPFALLLRLNYARFRPLQHYPIAFQSVTLYALVAPAAFTAPAFFAGSHVSSNVSPFGVAIENGNDPSP
jgi:hypothetical protein